MKLKSIFQKEKQIIKNKKEEMIMKFIKGMIVGGMIAAGTAIICADGMCANKHKMMKKGKQFARKLGMI